MASNLTLEKQFKIAQWNKMLDALQRTSTQESKDETCTYHIIAARNLYAAEFRGDIPSRQAFMRVVQKYRQYGSVVAPRQQRRRRVSDGPLRAAIAQHLQTDPKQSMRELAKLLNASRESVRLIVKDIKRSQQDEDQIQTPKVEKS